MIPVVTARPVRTTVTAARRLATDEWSRLLGDVSACTLAKDGRSHPAAKFYEGAVAALGEFVRQIADETDPAQAVDTAGTLSAGWADKRLPGGPEARDWEAYRAGGIQAMTDIAAELTPSEQSNETLETTP